MRELFRVRAALEGLAASEIIASPQRDEAVGDAPRGGARPARRRRDGDFATKLEADLGFHLLLCRLSGNSMLVDSWRYLEGRIRITIMNCEAPNGRPSMMARDRHALIVNAIESGDAAAAPSSRLASTWPLPPTQYAPADPSRPDLGSALRDLSADDPIMPRQRTQRRFDATLIVPSMTPRSLP